MNSIKQFNRKDTGLDYEDDKKSKSSISISACHESNESDDAYWSKSLQKLIEPLGKTKKAEQLVLQFKLLISRL
jgi:hypothetical protein